MRTRTDFIREPVLSLGMQPTENPTPNVRKNPGQDSGDMYVGPTSVSHRAPGAPDFDDDAAAKQMRRRVSPLGAVVSLVLVLGAGAAGVWWFRNEQAKEPADAWRTRANAAQNDEELVTILRSELGKATDDQAQVAIMRNLGHFRDGASVPLIVPFLKERGVIRASAAKALAEIGRPAGDPSRPALLEALKDTENDAVARPAVIWALTALGESTASDAIIEAFTKGWLQEQDNFDPKLIVDAIGPARLASDDLINHKQVSVRTLVAVTLAEAASPAVVEPLSKVLRQELARTGDDQSVEVIRAAAAGLGRTGDPAAAGPLFELLEKQPSMRSTVIDSMERTTPAPNVAALLPQAREVSLRRDLVRVIAKSHDPRIADTLAGFIADADADTKSTAAIGLADLGDKRALPALLEIANTPDEAEAMPALEAIKRLRAPEAAAGLRPILEQWPGRKAAILRALGASGDVSAVPLLMAELAGDDVGAAALALADLNDEGAYRKLLTMLPRPPKTDMSTPEVQNETLFMNRRAAIRGLGFYGRPDPTAAFIKIVEDSMDDSRLRFEAGQALGRVATADTLKDVVAKVKNPTTDENARRYFVQALWQKPAGPLAADLFEIMVSPSADGDLRRAAAIAIGYSADPANNAKLQELIASAETRGHAAFAIILGGDEATVRKLIGVLDEDRQLADLMSDDVNDTSTEYFNLVSKELYASGEVWTRIAAAFALREGVTAEKTYPFAWTHLVNRLKNGWDGPGGLLPHEIRAKVWETLQGQDAKNRRLAAELLGAMEERGLLLAARDSNLPGSEEARAILLRVNRM